MSKAVINLSRIDVDKRVSERRRTPRHDLCIQVHVCDDKTKRQQSALLQNINHGGLYLITRHRLAINQSIEIAVPTEPDVDTVKIRAQVVRNGNHRLWGQFSYGCCICTEMTK